MVHFGEAQDRVHILGEKTMVHKIVSIFILLLYTQCCFTHAISAKTSQTKDSDKEYTLINGGLNGNSGFDRENLKNVQYLPLIDVQRNIFKATSSGADPFATRHSGHRSSRQRIGSELLERPEIIEQTKENGGSTVIYDPNEPAQYREVEGSPTSGINGRDSRLSGRQMHPNGYPLGQYGPFAAPYHPYHHSYQNGNYNGHYNYGYLPPPGQYLPSYPYPAYPPPFPVSRPYGQPDYGYPSPSPPPPYYPGYYPGYYPPPYYPPPPYLPPYPFYQPTNGMNQFAQASPLHAAPNLHHNLHKQSASHSPLHFGATKSA